MTFRRISVNSFPAQSLGEARARALALYREWLREVPRTVSKYALDVPISLGRSRVRGEFERWRNLNSLPLINRRILLGTQELIETHNKWKQKPHVMRYFDGNPWDGYARVYQQGIGEESSFMRQFLNK